ncbi:hypothetical protein LguiA_025869 [Lonicera macranthoides]
MPDRYGHLADRFASTKVLETLASDRYGILADQSAVSNCGISWCQTGMAFLQTAIFVGGKG